MATLEEPKFAVCKKNRIDAFLLFRVMDCTNISRALMQIIKNLHIIVRRERLVRRVANKVQSFSGKFLGLKIFLKMFKRICFSKVKQLENSLIQHLSIKFKY